MNPQNQPDQPLTPVPQPQYQPTVEPQDQQLAQQPVGAQPDVPIESAQPSIAGESTVPQEVSPVAQSMPDPIAFAASQPNVPPLQAQSPVTAQSYVASPGGSPSGNKKLFIILGSVIGGVLVVAGIAAAVYFTLFFVSKDDFKVAAVTSGKAVTKLAEIDKPIIDLDEGSSSFDKATEAFAALEKNYGEYKGEAKKLADARAVKNDADAKRLYDAYQKKHQTHSAYMDKLIASKPAFAAIETCVGLSSPDTSSAEAYKALAQPCIDGLDAVKADQTNVHIMKLVGAYKTFLGSAIELIEASFKVNTKSTADLAKFNDITTKYYEGSQAFGETVEDVQDGLKKEAKDASPTESLRALQDKLNEKAK